MAEGFQLLTNSRRNSFGACHRRHYFEYELCRRPISDAEALRFGTLMHAGLEAWFLHLWEGTEVAYREAVAVIMANAPKEDFEGYTQQTALAMMHGYHARWCSEVFEVLAVEQHFEIPLVNPDTHGQSRTFRLAGKIDAIVRLQDGRVVIVEHKTTSEDLAADSKYWTKLAIDGQVSGYYMGAKSIGFDVEGCLYDVLRKPSIRPCKIPTLDENGSKIVLDPEGNRVFNKDGKPRQTTDTEKGYTLVSRPETPEEWYQRLLADITAQPERYFRRMEVPRLDSDLVEYLGDMWAVGREIAEAQQTRRWPKNPRSCDVYSGCPYFEVCAGRESIDNPHVFQESQIHRELAVEATGAQA